jgi:hypothetical protein
VKEHHPSTPRESAEELAKELEKHPQLRERLEAILSIVKQEDGEFRTADAAEFALIGEIRKLGNQALTDWARQGQTKAVEEIRAEQPRIKNHSKKN